MDEIQIRVLPPEHGFSSVRFRVSDKWGRHTEFSCSSELTIGSAIRLCTREHYHKIAAEEAARWGYEIKHG